MKLLVVLSLCCAVAFGLGASESSAQSSLLLYSNDFETPNVPPVISCASLDQRPIDTLYGMPDFTYAQQFTVEAVHYESYGARTEENGLYGIGMLAATQNDQLALTFDTSGREFLNVGMDLSAIDIFGCGGPVGVARVRMRMRLLDSPAGVFAWNQTELDSTELLGGPDFEADTLHFTRVVAALDASGSTDGHVSVVFDLLESGYASFDNLSIVAARQANIEDMDVDTITDDVDNCIRVRNTDQENADTDLAGDLCDPAPLDPTRCGDIDEDGADDCAPPPELDAGEAPLDDDAGSDGNDEPDASEMITDASTVPEGDAATEVDASLSDASDDDGGTLRASSSGCSCHVLGLTNGSDAATSALVILASLLMLLAARLRSRARS